MNIGEKECVGEKNIEVLKENSENVEKLQNSQLLCNHFLFENGALRLKIRNQLDMMSITHLSLKWEGYGHKRSLRPNQGSESNSRSSRNDLGSTFVENAVQSLFSNSYYLRLNCRFKMPPWKVNK
jgi:hypothetical protein